MDVVSSAKAAQKIAQSNLVSIGSNLPIHKPMLLSSSPSSMAALVSSISSRPALPITVPVSSLSLSLFLFYFYFYFLIKLIWFGFFFFSCFQVTSIRGLWTDSGSGVGISGPALVG